MSTGIASSAVNSLVDAFGNLIGWRGAGVDFGAVVMIGQSNVQITNPNDTTEDTLWQMIVPGGMMGPNDSLEVNWVAGTNGGAANAKTIRVRFGGTAFVGSSSSGTSGGFGAISTISNRNSTSAQVCANGTQGDSGTAGFISNGTVNTAQPQILAITGQKTVGSDVLTLERVCVKLLRAA